MKVLWEGDGRICDGGHNRPMQVVQDHDGMFFLWEFEDGKLDYDQVLPIAFGRWLLDLIERAEKQP